MIHLVILGHDSAGQVIGPELERATLQVFKEIIQYTHLRPSASQEKIGRKDCGNNEMLEVSFLY
jgi:hypothetical protein